MFYSFQRLFLVRNQLSLFEAWRREWQVNYLKEHITYGLLIHFFPKDTSDLTMFTEDDIILFQVSFAKTTETIHKDFNNLKNFSFVQRSCLEPTEQIALGNLHFPRSNISKTCAPPGNRTRVARMGILHDTTTPAARCWEWSLIWVESIDKEQPIGGEHDRPFSQSNSRCNER